MVVVGSFGPRGWPHLMPLWYVPRDGEVWIYTYAKSQKVRNLERDPRATLMIETGHEYAELRGVMVEAEAEIHRDIETVFPLAEELTLRYAEGMESLDGRRPRGAAGAGRQAGRGPLPGASHRELGPPQARRGLLARAPRRQPGEAQVGEVLRGVPVGDRTQVREPVVEVGRPELIDPDPVPVRLPRSGVVKAG